MNAVSIHTTNNRSGFTLHSANVETAMLQRRYGFLARKGVFDTCIAAIAGRYTLQSEINVALESQSKRFVAFNKYYPFNLVLPVSVKIGFLPQIEDYDRYSVIFFLSQVTRPVPLLG